MPKHKNEGESVDSPDFLSKRKIRPHKGNRNAVIFGGVRVTADEKELIQLAIERSGMKVADWLVRMAQTDLKL